MVWLYFGFACLSTIFLKLHFFPQIFRWPEMWHETGVKFWLLAKESSFLDTLFVKDSGYLTFIPRLVAQLTEWLQVPLTAVPLTYAMLGLSFIVVCNNFFLLPLFRSWMPSDLQRFVVCLAFNFYMNPQAQFTQNLGYHGGPPLFLSLISVPEIIRLKRRYQAVLAVFLSLVILSKGLMVLALPATGLLLALSVRRKNWPAVHFLGLPFLAALGQGLALVTSLLNKRSVGGGDVLTSLSSILKHAWLIFFEGAFGFTALLTRSWPQTLFIAAAGLVSLFFLVRNLRQRNTRVQIVFYSALALCVGWSLFQVLGSQIYFKQAVHSTFPLRRLYLPYSVLFLLGAVSVTEALKGKPRWALAALLLLWAGSPRFTPRVSPPKQNTIVPRFGDWTSFENVSRLDQPFCLPVNPYPNLLQRHCVLLEADPVPKRQVFKEAAGQVFAVPASAQGAKLQSIGLAFADPRSALSFELEAQNAAGQVLEVASGRNSGQSFFTFFHFTRAAGEIEKIRLRPTSARLAMLPLGRPLWVWLGTPPPEG